MTEPSCSVEVVSDVAVAEKGATFTIFPCMPSKPISSIGAPKGGGPSGPCLWACTATELNTRAPLNTKHIFNLGLIPLLLFSPRPRRVIRRSNLVLVFFLGQAHRLRQAVISNQQIHLDPLARALFIHRQAQCAKRTALHSHVKNRCFFRFIERGARQRRKL